ncbi:MAG TPA: 50S ribosomal protein L11 methyltransferase [Anaerolineae bacterium]|nr:50S ribosomal protein L11 methyltransferase [Anaerolineae bacterium]
MDFTEIAIIGIDGEAAEVVSDLFNRYGYGGAVIEALAPDFEKVTVRTVLPAEDKDRLREIEVLLALIGQALPKGLPEPRLQPVGASDWATSWKEHFHVVRIGRRFVIKPSWRDYTPAAEDIVIEIDPGLAFGSGLHPTTQLCLKIFEEMDLTDQELFDVGTGSGVLSIAALKSGAAWVRAVDVDDVAVRVADENFERNGLTNRVETAVGSAADKGGRDWPLVVANILAHILIEIMPGLAAALTPNGVLILSGMIADQENEVTQAAQSQGLAIVNRYSHEDWVALIAKKTSSASKTS